MVKTNKYFISLNSVCFLFYLDKTVKLWKISEKTKRAEGYNLRDDNGIIRSSNSVTDLRIPVIRFNLF